MQDLNNKVAVVTGGASGIGRAMAERFAAAGMKIVLADIESAALEATAKEMRAAGVDIHTQLTDVSDGAAVDALAASTLDHFGAVHIVCNNAGVATAGPVWAMTEADWKFTIGVNLWGVIHGVRAFAPTMLEQDEGHFVNTASMAGLVCAPGMGVYNVTKHGVVALTETLFEDLRGQGSNVGTSVLCPAFVNTKIWDSQRNRPDALKNDAGKGDSETYENTKSTLKTVIEHAMPAAKVADAVHDAVLANRLYILTHSSSQESVAKRMGHIVSGENPTQGAPDLQSLLN